MGRGDGLDMYLQLEGGFGTMRAILPMWMWGLGAKKWVKNLKISDHSAFDLSRRADHFGVVGCQNRMKDGQVMPIQSWGKSGVLAYFWLKIGYSGHIFWDMNFKVQICFAHHSC